jgi:hypothetical protein
MLANKYHNEIVFSKYRKENVRPVANDEWSAEVLMAYAVLYLVSPLDESQPDAMPKSIGWRIQTILPVGADNTLKRAGLTYAKNRLIQEFDLDTALNNEDIEMSEYEKSCLESFGFPGMTSDIHEAIKE